MINLQAPRTDRIALLGAAATLAAGTLAGAPSIAMARQHTTPTPPVTAHVFSPASGARAGVGGDGFIVDVALDATTRADNHLLSPAAGYKPFFNDPAATTFHPGPDMGAPGLVVMLSTTPNMPGTPFQGPRTNLAGLFQINGDATIAGGRAEDWSTWQPGKPLFGTGTVKLTVYAVSGTAPAVIPATGGPKRISNVVTVPFTIG